MADQKRYQVELEDVNVHFSDYLKVAKYAGYIKKEIILRTVLGVVQTASYVLQAVFMALGTAAVFDGTSMAKAAGFFGIVFLCILGRTFLVRYTEGYTKQIGGKIKTVLRELLVGKLMDLGPAYQMDKRSGRFQSLVTDGVEYMEPYFVSYIPQVFIVAISVTGIVIYIYSVSIPAGLIVTFSVLLAILMPHILMRFYTKACIGYWKNYAQLNSAYIDTMQGMNTLKVFQAEEYKGEELADLSERFRIRQLTNTRNSLFSTANIALMSGIATAVATGAAAYAASLGKISVGSLLAVMFLVIECVRPVGDLNTAWHACMMGFSVASEFLEILNEPVPVAEKENARKDGIDGDLPEVRFDHVSFQYSRNREFALQDVSFRIAPGEMAAVVGTSGAGKSTVANLLLRFFDTSSGTVSINGIPVEDFSLDYLRSCISVVFQNTYLFHGTIRENIAMARPDASFEEIVEAAKTANAHEFIIEFPMGYDTPVGERGNNLSGGQKQRIAIARAVLKRAPLIIMDEATSSVDAVSERIIRETMDQLQGKFTMLVIAHRLSTIQDADRILVLEKGKLTETGTHEELSRKKGEYYNLIEAQRRGESNV